MAGKTNKKSKKAANDQTLDKRFMIRCGSFDLAVWEIIARGHGFGGAAPLIRREMKALIDKLPKAERERIEREAREAIKAAG